MMAHQEYEELLTLAALDALDAPDRRNLEAHLESCSDCRAELAEMRDAAGLLAHASPAVEPRAEVRSKILDEVRKEARREAPASASTVVSFKPSTARSVWPSLLRIAAVIAFVAVVLGWIGSLLSWQHEQAGLDYQLKVQRQLLKDEQEARRREQEALALVISRDAKAMHLAATPTDSPARGTFVYDQKTGRGMLMTEGLPMAPAGMAYEVWFIPKGHSPMPGKTFTVDAAGKAMMMDEMPAEARENAVVAITLEPEKGSQSPTGPIYLSSPAS